MDEQIEVKPKPKTFREFIRSSAFLRPFLGIVLGGVAGFMYYHFVGCSSGTCAITSSPYGSTLMGSLLGLFVVNSPCSRGRC